MMRNVSCRLGPSLSEFYGSKIKRNLTSAEQQLFIYLTVIIGLFRDYKKYNKHVQPDSYLSLEGIILYDPYVILHKKLCSFIGLGCDRSLKLLEGS